MKKAESQNFGLVYLKILFLDFQFIGTVREGDWPFYLDAVEFMFPLFYASGHHTYAQSLPENVRDHFLSGEHTLQHIPGVFSRIWTDIAIETSYMKYGHSSSSDLVGQEIIPGTMKKIGLQSKCLLENGCRVHIKKQATGNAMHSKNRKVALHTIKMISKLKEIKLYLSWRCRLMYVFDFNHHPETGLINIATGKILNLFWMSGKVMS